MSDEPQNPEDGEVEGSYDANDRAQVNKARKKAARRDILRKEAIRKVMADRECRAWLSHILSFADIDGNPHVPGQPDSTAFNCGMSNLGRMIWVELREATPEMAVLMLQEAKDDEKAQQ